MRLTYRTVRVVVFIAEHPGASDRAVGEGARIHDAGQISQLLARLERLSLVENLGEGACRGAANAWRLADQGAALEHALRRSIGPPRTQ